MNRIPFGSRAMRPRVLFLLVVVISSIRVLAVDFVVQADGTDGAYSSVNAAIAAAIASPGGASGKVIEIRANTPGSTQVFAEGIDMSDVNIDSDDEADWLAITVREGDTIRFRSSGSLLYASGPSRGWKVEGNSSGYSSLQFGDLADFVHTGQNTYRTCYPQERGADIAPTCSHYAVRRALFTGGRAYFANIFDGSDYELDTLAGFDHGTNHHDIHPTSGERQDWGDTVSVRGQRVRLSNLTGRHGGHNGWGFLCTTAVLRDSDFSGYWGDISPSPGARAMIMEQVRAQDPYGPMLMENCVIRDSGDSIDETRQTAMKTEGSGLIIRDCFYFDIDAHLWHMNFTNAHGTGVSYFSNDAFYHNTSYISKGTWWNNFFDYVPEFGPGQFENNLIANNLFQEVSDNDKSTNPPQIFQYETTGTSFNGHPNGFHGTVISGNAVGGPSPLKQVRLFTSNNGSATFPIDAVPAAFAGNVRGNAVGEVTFLDVGLPRARTRTGFAVTDWGSALSPGDAPPLSTVVSASSGAVLAVANARPFYDGWGIRGEVGDYVYIGADAAAAEEAGPLQIVAIDYVGQHLTLTASRTVRVGDGVWFGGNPYNGGPAIRANRGAHVDVGTPPAAPTNLAVVAVSGNRVDLSWTDNASDETGFVVERKTGAGNEFSRIGVASANQTTLSDFGVMAETTYVYRVAAANGAAFSAWSNPVSVGTPPPPPAAPEFVTSPASQSASIGATVSLSVAANGYPAPTLQWRRNGAPISGATAATLVIASAQTSDSGVYDAVASNSSGVTVSAPAALAINSTGPSGKLDLPATSVVASTELSGREAALAVDGSLSTSWNARDNENPRDGEWIRFDLGAITTVDLVKIAWDPTTDRIFTYDLQLSLDGTTWTTLRNGVNNTGTGQLETDDIPDTEARYVRIWGYGSQVSPRFITIREVEVWAINSSAPPVVVQDPSDHSNDEHATVFFVVVATGVPDPTYQWFHDGSEIAGATSPVLALVDVRFADAGTYAVSIANSGGAVSSASALLTVRDITPPSLSLPGDLGVEATGPSGAVVAYSAGAVDAHDGQVAVELTPPSGSVFPLGTTTVAATATDLSGNTVMGSFLVTVNDTTAPVFLTPDDLTVEATRLDGATVHYVGEAVDIVDGSQALAFDPASGSVLPFGESEVTVWAVDTAGNIAADAFTVTVNRTAVVNHAPSINGGALVDGSVHVLLPESFTVNGGATLSRDLMVPGNPVLKVQGNVDYDGVVPGDGTSTPGDHKIALNGNVSLRFFAPQHDGFVVPAVAAPSAPSGTRSVVLNHPGDDAGDFATLRDLTLNGGAGTVAVPPGNYGRLTANGAGVLVLGVAGASEPVDYGLQQLTLNGSSQLRLIGPVHLVLAQGLSVSGAMGEPAHPEWLALRTASGGLTLNGQVEFHGLVEAPAGSVIINGGSALVGGSVSDRLILNGSATLELRNPPASAAP